VAFCDIGAFGGTLPERTLPLDRFLYQLYLLLGIRNPRRVFPPWSILNTFLRIGRDDHGMSGGTCWEPFEIGPWEYVEAVVALRARDAYDLTPPPGWVKSPADWHRWRYEAVEGYPRERARLLGQDQSDESVRTPIDDELMELARTYSDAQRTGDQRALQAAERALSDLVKRHGFD
jgi:hypothetical protein